MSALLFRSRCWKHGCLFAVQAEAALIDVTVNECGLGQVPQKGFNITTTPTCTLCAAVTYSFDPNNDTCPRCPVGAQCAGGATLVPEPPYWHSQADSNHMVLCPNPNACQRDTGVLLACQNSTYYQAIATNQVSLHSLTVKPAMSLTALTNAAFASRSTVHCSPMLTCIADSCQLLATLMTWLDASTRKHTY